MSEYNTYVKNLLNIYAGNYILGKVYSANALYIYIYTDRDYIEQTLKENN